MATEKQTKKEVQEPNYSEWSIYKKMQYVRNEMNKVGKTTSGYNPYANFNYMQLKDFLPELIELMFEVGLFSKFEMNETIAKLWIVNLDNEDEIVVYETPYTMATSVKSSAIQLVGATHTYMRRYLYIDAFDISVNDDVDVMDNNQHLDNNQNNNQKNTSNYQSNKQAVKAKNQPVKTVQDIPITPEQVRIIRTELGSDTERENAMLGYYQVNAIENMNVVQANEAIKQLQGKQ